MKKIIMAIILLFTINSCEKINKYHFASVGKVTIEADNNCGLILCINTDDKDGTDICTHPLNLDSSYQFGDTLLIEYRLTGDTFECKVIGWPYFGKREKKYPIVEILSYK